MAGHRREDRGLQGHDQHGPRAFPGVEVFATTLRGASTPAIICGARFCGRAASSRRRARDIGARPHRWRRLDRRRHLYGLIRLGAKCLQFGWASGAITTTFLTDYAACPTRSRSGPSGRATLASSAEPSCDSSPGAAAAGARSFNTRTVAPR